MSHWECIVAMCSHKVQVCVDESVVALFETFGTAYIYNNNRINVNGQWWKVKSFNFLD